MAGGEHGVSGSERLEAAVALEDVLEERVGPVVRVESLVDDVVILVKSFVALVFLCKQLLIVVFVYCKTRLDS